MYTIHHQSIVMCARIWLGGGIWNIQEFTRKGVLSNGMDTAETYGCCVSMLCRAFVRLWRGGCSQPRMLLFVFWERLPWREVGLRRHYILTFYMSTNTGCTCSTCARTPQHVSIESSGAWYCSLSHSRSLSFSLSLSLSSYFFYFFLAGLVFVPRSALLVCSPIDSMLVLWNMISDQRHLVYE